MKILLIGPLPNPVTGEALANQTFLNFLRNKHIPHSFINTTGYKNIQSSHGKFSFSKLIHFVRVYLNMPKIITHRGIIYITIGQTFLGVVKYAPFILLAIFLKKPYHLHLHGNYLGQTYQTLKGSKQKFFKWLITHAQSGIVLSESLKSNFQHLLPEEKIKIVENFASETLYRTNLSQKQYQNLHLLFLSNLYPEKGILDFLEALLLLQQAGIPFKASIGGSFEVSSQSVVYQKMKEIDDSTLEYHGFVSGLKKQKLLVNANVFVLPTYYKVEGQPISIIEALATGNIIVTTQHGGIPDIISDKQGFFVDKKSPANLFATLKYIAHKLPQLSYMCEANRAYAMQRFSEERFGNNLLQILRNN